MMAALGTRCGMIASAACAVFTLVIGMDEERYAIFAFESYFEIIIPLRIILFSSAFLLTIVAGWYFGSSQTLRTIRKPILLSLGIFLVLSFAAADRRLDLVAVTGQSIRLATPIALGAMAGILCERCGVINIAIEGMMLIGACAGYVAALVLGNSALGVPIAILAGVMVAGLHALLALRFKTDQIISGTVINVLAIGLTGYIRRVFLLKTDLTFPGLLPTVPVPILTNIPILGSLFFTHQPIVYTALILVPCLHLFLFRTRWGLRTRACGEHPLAAATVGINVLRKRAVNILLAGGVAGLAGAWFSLETTGVFEDLMTNGKGFIALAAMIFGRWSPIGSSVGAFLFGFSDALQIKLQILGINVPYQFLGMLPYVVTMIVLAGFMGKATPPAAIGKPFPEK